MDIRNWLGNGNVENISLDVKGMPKGKYEVLVGIGGKGYPMAYFATDAAYDNGYYRLFEFEIK